MRNLFRFLNNWAESWSYSQFLFVLVIVALFAGLLRYQAYRMHDMADRMQAQENKIWAYKLLLRR